MQMVQKLQRFRFHLSFMQSTIYASPSCMFQYLYNQRVQTSATFCFIYFNNFHLSTFNCVVEHLFVILYTHSFYYLLILVR